MNIHIINETDLLWLLVAEYANTCSWDACARMASFMKDGKFNDWERLFVAEENGVIMGFCALIKSQGFPALQYTPLIKWLFIEEKYRGQRLSQRLIDTAGEYAKKLEYEQVFLTTWHKGLYEKYGFEKLCDKEVREGCIKGVYRRNI